MNPYEIEQPLDAPGDRDREVVARFLWEAANGVDSFDGSTRAMYLEDADELLGLLRRSHFVNPLREQGGTMDAREEAVDAMARAYYNWTCLIPDEPSRWDEPDESGGFSHQHFARARAGVMLDALLPPRSVECAECDEGNVPWESGDGDWHDAPCEFCSGSGRIEKGPIAYLASELTPILALNDDGAGGTFTDENGTQRSYSRPQTSRVIGYRLLDESPKGGA